MARENNFDALRLFAAALVLIGHSFAIMGHKEYPTVFGNQLSVYGLFIFFSISGYLISKSWKNDPHIGRFFLKRSLRIFPGLVVMVLLSTFVLGPLVSQEPPQKYFADRLTYDYLRNIGLYFTYPLSGVFIHNPVPYSPNVSIWSLPVEFFMYLVTPAVILLSSRCAPVAFAVLTALFGFSGIFLTWHYSGPAIIFYGTDVRAACAVSAYFTAGAIFGTLGSRFRFSIGAVVAVGYVLAMHFTGGWISVAVLISAMVMFTYLVLLIGAKGFPGFRSAGRWGDFSYGMYLYAFPVQQTIALYFPKMNIYLMIVLALIVTLGLAAASWRLVEKPAQSLKPRRRVPILEPPHLQAPGGSFGIQLEAAD